MGKFSRIHHHISKEDLKRVNEQKVRAKKLESERIEEERKEIKAEFEQLKFNWRKDISESDFTNITKGNTISQTFQHTSGATITLDNTMSDTSEIPTQVTLDLGFGEKITVDAPGENEYGIAGVTKPLDKKVMQKQNVKTAKEINDQLDASKKVSGVDTAKVDVGEDDLGYKSTDEILADVGDQWTYPEYIDMMNKITIQFSDRAEPLEKLKQDYIKNNKDVPISIIDAIDAIVKAQQAAYNALDKAWEKYNKVPDLPDGGEEEKPTGLTRVLTGIADLVTGNVADFDKRGNLKQAVMKAATKIPKLDRYQTPVNAMLTYDRFLHNMGKNNSSSSIEGSTENNRIDITNNISKKDIKYLESKMSKLANETSTDKILTFNNSLKALTKSNTSESDANEAKEVIKKQFARIYQDKAALVATFGGTGEPGTGENEALPEVLNVKETGGYYEVTVGKSYAFREGGSEPITKGLLGLYLKTINAEPDTVGSDTISAYAAPAAAKLGITGDKYFKKENDPFSLYNSPDMHYKVTIRIKKNEKKKKVNESTTFSKIKKFRNK
tara:strand:+ start:290 stop:1954 length:1665 start_codon:yes stop_codon:yes gene_type:complete